MRKKEHSISIKHLTIILLLAAVILLGIIIYMFISERDMEAPVITCEDEAVYLSEADVEKVREKDYSCLLNGITAEDNRDGDVSDRVIVYSTDMDSSNAYMTVSYRVMDLTGNVGVCRRLVYLMQPSEIHELQQEMIADYLNMDIAEVKALMGEEMEDNEAVGNDSEDDGLEADAVIPQLTMETEVTISRDSFFNPLSYIIDLTDDTDSVEYLLTHGHMEGSVDTHTPGVYAVTFYVTDSDGNDSNSVTVFVTVEE